MLLAGGTTGGIEGFLTNLTTRMGNIGMIVVVIIGVVMLVVGVFQVAKGLIGGQRSQVSWPMAIILILLGAALSFGGGWSMLQGFSQMTNDELNSLTGGQVTDMGTGVTIQ